MKLDEGEEMWQVDEELLPNQTYSAIVCITPTRQQIKDTPEVSLGTLIVGWKRNDAANYLTSTVHLPAIPVVHCPVLLTVRFIIISLPIPTALLLSLVKR